MRPAIECKRAAVILLSLLALSAVAVATATDDPDADNGISNGVTWAQRSIAALTGGKPVSAISESGLVTRTVGEDSQSDSISLVSSGIMASDVEISTSDGILSESRAWAANGPIGQWSGIDGKLHQITSLNRYPEAVWFFPALSLLADYANPNLVFVDLGPQQLGGQAVEHLQVYRSALTAPPSFQKRLRSLSAVDYYVDAQTGLPLALSYNMHGDTRSGINIPVMVIYGTYKSIDGIQVPFQLTQFVNGSRRLQVQISNALPSN